MMSINETKQMSKKSAHMHTCEISWLRKTVECYNRKEECSLI